MGVDLLCTSWLVRKMPWMHAHRSGLAKFAGESEVCACHNIWVMSLWLCVVDGFGSCFTSRCDGVMAVILVDVVD